MYLYMCFYCQQTPRIALLPQRARRRGSLNILSEHRFVQHKCRCPRVCGFLRSPGLRMGNVFKLCMNLIFILSKTQWSKRSRTTMAHNLRVGSRSKNLGSSRCIFPCPRSSKVILVILVPCTAVLGQPFHLSKSWTLFGLRIFR